MVAVLIRFKPRLRAHFDRAAIYRTAAGPTLKPKNDCAVRAILPPLNGGACRAPGHDP